MVGAQHYGDAMTQEQEDALEHRRTLAEDARLGAVPDGYAECPTCRRLYEWPDGLPVQTCPACEGWNAALTGADEGGVQ